MQETMARTVTSSALPGPAWPCLAVPRRTLPRPEMSAADPSYREAMISS